MNSSQRTFKEQFAVKFWGTRGTRALTDSMSKYGNNTTCIEVRCGDRVLIFDGGSGFINFGDDLSSRPNVKSFDLFLSHAHYDHVEGIPHFHPFYNDKHNCSVWAGPLDGVNSTKEIFSKLINNPFFPIDIEKFKAGLRFNDIVEFETIDLGDGIIVHTCPLNHPGGATAYRVEYCGNSFGFVTDNSHDDEEKREELVSFLEDIDLFVYDCTYTNDELKKYPSYGHSTWEESLRLRDDANAKSVLGIHHVPSKNDDDLDKINAAMNKHCGKSGLAKEGETVS